MSPTDQKEFAYPNTAGKFAKKSKTHHRNPSNVASSAVADRIDKWLLKRLDRGDLPDLAWLNRRDGLFRIDWQRVGCCSPRMHRRQRLSKIIPIEFGKHEVTADGVQDAGYSGCSSVFAAWDWHRGRSGSIAESRRLKQNLRCALNGSRRHLLYRRDLSRRGGANPYRVYQFVDDCAIEIRSAYHASPANPSSTDLGVASDAVNSGNGFLGDWLFDHSPLVSDSDPCMLSSSSIAGFAVLASTAV